MRTTLLFGSVTMALAMATAGCGGGIQRANVDPEAMPNGGTFTGVWNSPQYGEMHLIQHGDRVVGEYKKNERRGIIRGKVQGNVLRFQFEERRELVQGNPNIAHGRGYFRYLVDPADGSHKLLGEWGVDNSETGGGEWNAVKLETRDPKLKRAKAPGGASAGGAQPTASPSGSTTGTTGTTGSSTSSGSGPLPGSGPTGTSSGTSPSGTSTSGMSQPKDEDKDEDSLEGLDSI